MKEIWKDILHFEGEYQVSNLGRIKSLARSVKAGSGYRITNEKILNPIIDSFGYCTHTLRKKGIRKTNTVKVHRIVALHYIPNPLDLTEINHINGIKTDNQVDNLEWCTRSFNLKHAYKLGLRKNKTGCKYNTK